MAGYVKKYKKGKQITKIEQILDKEFIYAHDKVYHAGWFQSWSLGHILRQIKYGVLYEAIRTEAKNGKNNI